MTSFGWPDNFCVCLSLKKGGYVIAGLCFLTSFIACVMLGMYLGNDFNDIAKEISDNNAEMKQRLKENADSALAIAWTLFLTSLALLITSIMLFYGIQRKSKTLFVPFLVVLLAAIIITSVIAIIQLNKGLFFAVATLVVVLIYFFICLSALYKNLDAAVLNTRDAESY